MPRVRTSLLATRARPFQADPPNRHGLAADARSDVLRDAVATLRRRLPPRAHGPRRVRLGGGALRPTDGFRPLTRRWRLGRHLSEDEHGSGRRDHRDAVRARAGARSVAGHLIFRLEDRRRPGPAAHHDVGARQKARHGVLQEFADVPARRVDAAVADETSRPHDAIPTVRAPGVDHVRSPSRNGDLRGSHDPRGLSREPRACRGQEIPKVLAELRGGSRQVPGLRSQVLSARLPTCRRTEWAVT
mmetsp:Transcript_11697/g.36071  ORF Transcript_11697/g.36071 Transcript_11697/m.36071 type:complete len:245 (+) Transcript_11697:377-1111(+)